MMRRVGSAVLGLLAILCALHADERVLAQPLDPSLYADLRWRLIGPFRGGWGTVAEGVPDDPAVYYLGNAAGGVWKTEDAGRTWSPIFDRAGTSSVGALAVAPSNPKVIYVGTGHIQARYDIGSGDGMYRSDDAGATWRRVGLTDSRAIGRILVDPKNPDVVLVAALGHIFGPNRERGVFRSEDGGKNWRQVLFVDEGTGGADLAADPDDPSIFYAALWQARNYPWLSYWKPMVGPGSAIYKSVDGGRSWKRLSGGGWPAESLGRIGLAASSGGRVWALVDAAAPPGKPSDAAGLWRSDDGGARWARVNSTPGLGSSYMNRLTADPRSRDAVYVTGQSIRRSEDGGKTLHFYRGAPGGDDYHYLWINPKRPECMVTAADQGTIVTVNGGKSWSDWYNQPTGQFYHVETDDRFPYKVYSGQQDSGTVGAATRSDDGVLTYRDWRPVGGEERGWDVPDPRDPDIVYGTGLGGTITRFDARTSQVKNVSPVAETTYGRRPAPGMDRWAWCFPLAISPKPPHALYTGSQYLLRSLDEGASWEKASPDLTGAVAGTKGCQGDVTVAAARPCGFGTIYTIELSPLDPDEVWIGTDDGLIQRTPDAGKTWKNVTPKGLPAWSKISSLDVSPLEPGVVYAAIDAHRIDDFTPHVYRTRDGGASWQEVSAGLPAFGFVTVVRADTVRKGLLYAGTDTGVFVSFDDGNRWQPLQTNLPVAWMTDLKVHGQDLVLSTQGRGLWVLDDVTPLRRLTAAASSTKATLVPPAEAIRVRANMYRDTPLPPEVPFARNPPPGAIIDYVLGEPAKTVKLEILDAKGSVVRAYASDDPPESLNARRYFTDLYIHPPAPPATDAGHHRFVWDLRYPRPLSERYEYMISAVAGQNTPAEPRGYLALPGRYTVRLTVDGAAQEQPMVLVMDPRVKVAAAALQAQLALQQKLAAAMAESFGAAEKFKGQPEAKAFTAVNETLGTILNALDAADAAPTAIQQEAYVKARTDLDRLLANPKKAAAAYLRELPEDPGETEP
jgi:photosystem II stability/assembly factor-like uncharacterized protein